MATAIEQMRRQALRHAVFQRFTTTSDPRVKALVGDHAWLLAQHAVDAVIEAEVTVGAARTPVRKP